MTVTTAIPGDPAELTAIATWLRSSLGGALDGSELTLQSARQDDGGWDGTAGDAFRTRMSTAYTNAANLNDALVVAASGIDTFALALTTAQSDAAAARETAAAAGLTLTTTGIRAPAIWPIPVPPAPGSSAASVQSYYLAQDAQNDNAAHWQAYAAASVELSRITRTLAGAAEALDDVRADVEVVTVPVGSFLSSGVVDSLWGVSAEVKNLRAADLLAGAEKLKANVQLPGAGMFPTLAYKDLDDAVAMERAANGYSSDAERALRTGRVIGASVGAVLTGVSIWMDVRAGESATQATLSNSAGLATSILAGAAAGTTIGAATGTIIPVPIVGTLVGAVGGAMVGTAVGIITSGFVDSLFENGPNVHAAVVAGARDLADVGDALWDLGTSSARAVSDGASRAIDWAADGLSDAYDWAFG